MELITKKVKFIATKIQEQIFLLVSMVVYIWDQEIGGANSSSGCIRQVPGVQRETQRRSGCAGSACGGEGIEW